MTAGVGGRGGGEGVRIRDHLANVRTLLAWLRAGLVLMAMGYAVARFQVIDSAGERAVGIAVSISGWLVVAVAGARFLRQRGAIESESFAPTVAWDFVLTLLAGGSGIGILTYLIRT